MHSRHLFYVATIAVVLSLVGISLVYPPILWAFVLVGPLAALGAYDILQKQKAILRNFPVVGHGRYLFEMVRPGIQQYFVEDNIGGRPYDRNRRSVVYQRAKNVRDTSPFGTELDVYKVGYEWINHSLAPAHTPKHAPRIRIGGKDCKQPYDASLLNISAMSFGSLSNRAIEALNAGAAAGGFYHNTGEGSVSAHHLSRGGDLCWQLGTGYFGCRAADGGFDPDKFANMAARPSIKLIEIGRAHV